MKFVGFLIRKISGDNLQSVRKSLHKLQQIINCNITSSNKQNAVFVTLTYGKEAQTSNSELYHDFRLFIMRFKHYLKKKGLLTPEYICVVEPQGRLVNGKAVLHCHVIFIWPCKSPFIPNSELADLWQHGYTFITALSSKKYRNCDNLGLYLGRVLIKFKNR